MVSYYSYKRPLIAWKANKGYASLVAMRAHLLERFKKELTGFDLSGTTIHFTVKQPLPASLIRKIVKARLAENIAWAKTGVGRMTGRKHYKVPDFVKRALVEAKLMAAYQARPPYQRNDYVGWITHAAQEATKGRRLRQMLAKLSQGGVYMKMKHTGSMKKK